MRSVVSLSVLLVSGAVAASVWPEALPDLRLKDPLGKEFTSSQLSERGVVVLVTAPNLSQGATQEAWDAAFRGAKRDPEGPAVVILEDMTQSWFRPLVLGRMKETYKPGASIVLLLDEVGTTRKAFGVPDNTTVAFAFAPGGKRVAVETAGATVERAQKLLTSAAGR
jgi:hypothetical protein